MQRRETRLSELGKNRIGMRLIWKVSWSSDWSGASTGTGSVEEKLGTEGGQQRPGPLLFTHRGRRVPASLTARAVRLLSLHLTWRLASAGRVVGGDGEHEVGRVNASWNLQTELDSSCGH